MFSIAGAKWNVQCGSLSRMLWRCRAQPGLDCTLASMTPIRVDGNAVGQKPLMPRYCFAEDVIKWEQNQLCPTRWSQTLVSQSIAPRARHADLRCRARLSVDDTRRKRLRRHGARVFNSCGTGCSSSMHPTVNGDNLCARLPFACRIALYAH